MTNLHISFTGEYHNTLDQKNRLNIPAKFRKVLDPVNGLGNVKTMMSFLETVYVWIVGIMVEDQKEDKVETT